MVLFYRYLITLNDQQDVTFNSILSIENRKFVTKNILDVPKYKK